MFNIVIKKTIFLISKALVIPGPTVLSSGKRPCVIRKYKFVFLIVVQMEETEIPSQNYIEKFPTYTVNFILQYFFP
jgi:hypothetical protein